MIDRAAIRGSIRSAPAVVLAFALAIGAGAVAGAAEPLRAYVADASGTSVSGMSSGGFMAAQFQVAFSNDVIGAGIAAGGPYYCSEGKAELALARCTGTWAGPPDPARLVAFAREAAAKDEIDPLENLARQRVLVFGGMLDTIVTPPVVAALGAFYREAGVPPERLEIRTDLPAGHGFATQDFGSTCAATMPPFVNACGFDLAGAILRHIYGSLQPPAQEPSGRLVEFDQSEFLPDARAHGLDDTGLVYVPGSCEQDARRCRLHIVFHGCLQGRERLGDLFATRTGYNRWADSNGLIVLYPQAVATPRNPDGCWDWFGYDDPAFYARSGRQMAAVKAMLDRIVAPGR